MALLLPGVEAACVFDVANSGNFGHGSLMERYVVMQWSKRSTDIVYSLITLCDDKKWIRILRMNSEQN